MVRTRASLQISVISSPQQATKPEPLDTKPAFGSEQKRRKKTPSRVSKDELVQAAKAALQHQTTDGDVKPTRVHARKQSKADVKKEVKTEVKAEAEVVSICDSREWSCLTVLLNHCQLA